MTDSRLLDLRISEMARAVGEGNATAVSLVGEATARIDARDDRVRAWVCRDERATEIARRRDDIGDRGPLQGVPVGVKDIIDVAGLPTRCGTGITSPEPVTESATCVRRLEELGAVVLGKTVTTEYAYFAPGPTDNPNAPGHTPGGSSSGSAAAVAAGMVPLALGSQTAGSLTRPASYCGVAGMVLSHGVADLTGITGLSPSLDSLGLLTPSVDDLAYVYSALIGSLPTVGESRVYVWRGSDLDRIEPAMVEAVERAISAWTAAGNPVDELDFDDHIRTLTADHMVIMGFEAARERPEALARADELSEPLAALLRGGAEIPEAEYEHACYRRDRSSVDLEGLLGAGVVIGPAALGAAPEGLAATGSAILSRAWQALGLPQVTVPGIRSSAGLPLGIQVIGMPGAESSVLAVAAELERLVKGIRTQR